MTASNNLIMLGLVLMGTALNVCPKASGSVIEYTDWEQWQAAAGDYSTIDFTDQSPGTIITDQYSDLGAIFTDGDESVFLTPTFAQDGSGVSGSFSLSEKDQIAVLFDTPRYWVGVHYPGISQIELYSQGELFFTSVELVAGAKSGFTGLVSTQPFDRIRMFDPFGFVYMDNLYFGGVPAPGALPLLGALLIQSRRRR